MIRRLARTVAVAALLAGVLATGAHASTNVAGTGEPAFTNSATNTNWAGWTKFSSYYRFYLAFYAFTNNAQQGPFNSAYFGNQFPNAQNVSGEESFSWNSVTLNEGSSYGVCATGEYSLDNTNLFFPESQNSCGAGSIDNKRSTTTIDRTKPTISVAVSGTDEYTKTVPIPVVISYSDNLAFPFPATFICSRTGLDPAVATTACNAPGPAQFNYSSVCSVPANPASSLTAFNCTVTDTPPLPDGPVTVCAISADASIPDNPSSSNQAQTSDKANLSASQCGYVRVDRTAPGVSFTAPMAAKVGDLVSFSGSVTDAGSGASGTISWAWGDNTAGASGAAATHTYTQAGTFTITMSSTDKVGNASQATQTITVTSPPPVVPPGSGATPGGTGGTSGAGAAGTPAGSGTAGSGGTVTPPPSAAQITQLVGGSGVAGATQRGSAGGLDVLTASKVKLTKKLKALPLALTAASAGRATFALVIGGRIVSQAGLDVTSPGSIGFRLKVPAALRPGRYRLKISFTPKGASVASVKTLAVTFTASAKRKRARHTASTSSRPSPEVRGAPPATVPDGRLPRAMRSAGQRERGIRVG